MWFEYFAYLIFTLFGIAVLSLLFNVNKNGEWIRSLKAVLIPGFIFLVWDIVAVELGHWSFGKEFMAGFFILNQPIEEVLFFLVVPFFYLTVWQILKKGEANV